jgi:hypothetical protein
MTCSEKSELNTTYFRSHILIDRRNQELNLLLGMNLHVNTEV